MSVVTHGALRRFSLATLPVTPWRNGGGETREIACVPPGAEDFDWRLSVATIAQSGAFSRFAGVDRVITLLTGPGVRLRLDGEVVHELTTPLVPFAFAGETDVHAELVGECQDFNVMVRRERLRADVRVQRAAAPGATTPAHARDALWTSTEGGAVLVTGGAWALSAPAGGAQTLAAGEGAWWEGAADWRIAPASPGATILIVRLLARDGA